MGKIAVFGAGGMAGRHIVDEAVNSGHAVTAVVRDPSKHADLASGQVSVKQGDVTDVFDVASIAAGHDAAANAAARADMDATAFYTAATNALITGLAHVGVKRLVLIGMGTTLTVGGGVPIHDLQGFPAAGLALSRGHVAELEILERDGAALDWLVLAPPPVVLDDQAPRTGAYRIGGRKLVADTVLTFSYADLAVAVVDELIFPSRFRELAAVTY